MAKNALGKGLGALLGDNSKAAEEVAIVTGATKQDTRDLLSAITSEADGSLWIDPGLLRPNPKQPRVYFDPSRFE